MNFAFVHVRAVRAAILCAAVFVSTVDHSHATEVAAEVPKHSTDLSVEQRSSLEPVLRGLLQAQVDRQERLPGQAKIIVVGNVFFNDSGDRLLVELGKGYVPTWYGGDFEDQINGLATTVYVYMEAIGSLSAVEFTFEGRDILDYFPYERGLKEQADNAARSALFRPADAGKGRVLVSAGHGYYFHKKLGWTTQRRLVNGVIENFATPAFAALLDSYLQSRSDLRPIADLEGGAKCVEQHHLVEALCYRRV